MNIKFFGLDRQYLLIQNELTEATHQVLKTGRLMDGPFTEQFCAWLSSKNQTRHAVTCHSGTNALEIIAKYWRNNYEVQSTEPIVHLPTLTFPATANAFMNTGWRVQLLDCDSKGQAIHNHDIEYKAFHCYVGLFGAPPQIPLITSDVVIEDAAQHWLSNGQIRVSYASAISFDPTKNLNSSGNGGAIVTDDPNFYDWILEYQAHGKPNHFVSGTNTRMSELECSHLLVRAQYIDDWQMRRRDIAERYNNAFLDNPNVESLIDNDDLEQHGLQKYVIKVEDRDILKGKLKQDGIETRIHYQQPLHEMPAYQICGGGLNMLSTASVFCRKVLSLPLYPELTDDEVDYIIERVLHHTSS